MSNHHACSRKRAAARSNVPAPHLSARGRAVLMAHSWPGNVRELENVMEAAVLLCRSGEVDVDHLPGVGTISTPSPEGNGELARGASTLLAPWLLPDAPVPPPMREAREVFDKAYLDLVLTRTGGNVTAAAKLAGRKCTDFYDLLRRHGRSPNRDG